jgi:hypothetical protein
MDYNTLYGKKVNYLDSTFVVKNITRIVESDGSIKYEINGMPISKFDLMLLITLNTKTDDIKKTFIDKLLNKYGLFSWNFNTIKSEVHYYFKINLYKRTYGYKTTGLAIEFHFLKRLYKYEICWHQKDVYLDKQFPDDIADFKRVI